MLTQEELTRLHHQAQTELKKMPGVIGVGYGAKEVGGRTTDQLAFRVYVAEKKEKQELEPGEIIPADFKGIPTDVIKIPQIRDFHCEDLDNHSPLNGGISISNLKEDSDGIAAGTLGFFATIDGVSGPENVVLVSNNHVLMDKGAQVGDTIYQPKFEEVGGVIQLDPDPGRRNPVAKIHNVGLQDDHNYTYEGPGEVATDYYIDCATAKLNISISSWCNTNCGVSFKNEIRGLNIGGKSAIADVARAKPMEPVFKVGRSTGRTVGRVKDVAGVGQNIDTGKVQNNIIIIEPTENNCNNVMQFSAESDSGSAIVNADNEIIGILFGGNPAETTACHIHPALDQLSVTVISTANPHSGEETISNVPGVITETNINQMPVLTDNFSRTAKGREVYELFQRHRFEVSSLVNQRRPVTVAWHRNQGPAFLSHLLNNARDPSHLVPAEIEGIYRETLLREMMQVLLLHGSSQLKVDIEQYNDEALDYMNRFDSLHELIDQFEPVKQNG